MTAASEMETRQKYFVFILLYIILMVCNEVKCTGVLHDMKEFFSAGQFWIWYMDPKDSKKTLYFVWTSPPSKKFTKIESSVIFLKEKKS